MFNEVVEAVSELVNNKMKNIHTAIPCSITDVDKETGLVSVKPIGKVYPKKNVCLDYPEIFGVPLVFPQSYSQNISITYPVRKGDNGLLIFSESDMGLWRGEESSSNRFTLNSAVCIPGLFNTPNKNLLKSLERDEISITNGNTSVTVRAGEVEIIGNLIVRGKVTEV